MPQQPYGVWSHACRVRRHIHTVSQAGYGCSLEGASLEEGPTHGTSNAAAKLATGLIWV